MKLKLDEGDMENMFFEDTGIIGIVSGLPAYRLCWMLNNYFDIDFRCEPEMTLELKIKGNTTYLPVYQYLVPNTMYRYLLYKLKIDNASLLPEINRMDYMLLVQTGESFAADASFLSSEIKKIPDIILSQLFSRDQLKNLKNLLV